MHPSNGGPCQGIRNSIPALKKMGVENEVLCFDEKGIDYGINDDFIIHQIGPAKGPYSYCPKMLTWLEENIKNYDAVIIHGLWLYNSYGAYSILKKLKKQEKTKAKLYVMPHGMLDPYFQRAPERKLKAIRNTIFWHLFEKKVVNGADGILFTCERELELARKTFNDYHPKREINVGYGIQSPPIRAEQAVIDLKQTLGIDKNESYLLFLSRIHEKKGVDLVIKTYLQIKSEGKINVPKLVIAGPLDSDYSKQMQDLAKETKDIIFVGMLKGEQKWAALYGAEVFLLPSHQENFGIAVVEAMACQTPVLISNKVNIYTEIIEGKGGMVETDSLEGCKKMLEKWLQLSDEKKIQYQQNARKTYETYFTIEQAAQQLRELL